jgi:hypothetical protein
LKDLRDLEVFRANQRVDKVNAESDCDDETDEGITHGASQPVAQRNVHGHKTESAEPESEIEEIKHGPNPVV